MGGKKEEQDSSEYGEPAAYDPTFNGPIHNRSCTDIICCVLFMLVVTGYLVVGILAWLYGDPRHVLYPRNSTGMFCGVSPNQDKPNVFYFNILNCATATNIMAAALNGLQCPTTQICVSSCPSNFWALNPLAYLPNADLTKFFQQDLCVPSFNLSTTSLTATQIINKELCPSFYTPTTAVLGRCLPSLGPEYNNVPSNFSLPGMSNNATVNVIKNATSDLVSSFNARDVGVRIFADFASTWQWIVLGLVIAMVVSLLFLLLLRFLAAILIWILILGVLAVGAFGIWYCYREYAMLANSTVTYNNVGFSTNVDVYLQIRDTWLAFLILLSVAEAVLLLTLIFLRTRILIAIALIRESSKAVSYMMTTLIYPLVSFVFLVVCVSYWGITALYLATSGAPVYNVVALNMSQSDCSTVITGNQTCDPLAFNSSMYPSCPSARCVFIKYNKDGLFQRNLFNLQIYNVFAFLWCVNFVIALGQCTLAGAFASYYWAFHKPSDIPTCPLASSFMRALRYHVGSLAFGALILTIVQIIRIILEYIDHKCRAAQNCCVRFILCCLKCCFWCLEKFIKFLNRNAYIMIAIYGKNFCVSAKNAFLLLMRNIIRVVVLDKVTDLLLFFGRLLVVGGVGVLAFYFFSGRLVIPGVSFTASALNYYWMPIIAVVFGAYLIAHGFFSVYNMCVDTLFLCFLEDLERNDGSAEKPYYMSKSLMKILNKKNKQPNKQ
ncbi:choline transporter-like protein 4 [Electrophorus electricus]|uniref:choline transporter-like protein 4 n=1 Tax=Electrophorus electricus TaxID=8005 RepID=UPI000F0A1D48|nr:choline transporter-like protein 4 [Electrophorus electricus]